MFRGMEKMTRLVVCFCFSLSSLFALHARRGVKDIDEIGNPREFCPSIPTYIRRSEYVQGSLPKFVTNTSKRGNKKKKFVGLCCLVKF